MPNAEDLNDLYKETKLDDIARRPNLLDRLIDWLRGLGNRVDVWGMHRFHGFPEEDPYQNLHRYEYRRTWSGFHRERGNPHDFTRR
jgi:hypothetical protein